jgi:hypothetical protein
LNYEKGPDQYRTPARSSGDEANAPETFGAHLQEAQPKTHSERRNRKACHTKS